MLNSNGRLVSIIKQLPLSIHTTPRLLNIGCGAFVEAGALRHLFPGWAIIGLDIVPLKRKTVWQVQADALHLPFACKFGLILIRHPDVAKYHDRWKTILEETLPYTLNGLLLVTTYTQDEIEFVQKYIPLPTVPIFEQELAAVDLIGRDRYFLCATTEP